MNERTEMHYYPADEDWFARHHDDFARLEATLDLDPNPWVKEYRVYYMGVFCTSFDKRDDALDYVVTLVAEGAGYIEDYEILDGSDFL
jgi:hypothetical protein